MLKSDMTFVPYKGTAPAMSDIMGGQVDLMCEQATNSTPQIEAKKVKAYGITSARALYGAARCRLVSRRSVSRAFLASSFTVWHGVYAPQATPPAVLEKINQALRAALQIRAR